MRRAIGYFLLAVSVVAWGAIATMLFLEISVGDAVAVTAGLIVAGEVTFFLGVILLGKEAWQKIKTYLGKKGRNIQS